MISIIIPTLNEENVLEETLKNIRKIKSTSYELIISDGNSTDRTVEIARKYTDNIVVYKGKKRQTIAGGRNLGASIAGGNYLVFQDADVVIPDPDVFFRKAIRVFKDDPEMVGITVSIKVMKEFETRSDKILFGAVNYIHFIANNILGRGSASGEFQMIKRDSFLKASGYNETLVVVEDNDMFARLSRIGKTGMVRDLVVFHTGRRAHKVGWPRLLASWLLNGLSVALFKKAAYKKWKPIR
ncbi:PGL/p-HBAD biosynthesis glycosyltransferase/MT3031 [bacterium BMS3Abin09]|nr:PGL/p-HBAD biosynthesis glycosyltransferase/MT3031 [bacterium BMS3Abin09]